MHVHRHLNHLTLAGYRPRTVQSRRDVLRNFTRSINVGILDASRDDIESFLARPLAPESRRAYRTHLRGFYLWALDEGLITTDPSAKVPPIRVPLGTPRPIPARDLAHAIDRAPGRMRAWLLLMALAGLRCIEVANLRPADVQATAPEPMLFLRECKGGGTAVVPAHPEVLAALARLPMRDRLWWTCTEETVSKQVNAYLRGLGISSTAHSLRHFAGTSWYRESDHDVLVTARLLRHRSTQTVQVYAEIDPTRPGQVVRRVQLPPRDDAA
jgi:integrase